MKIRILLLLTFATLLVCLSAAAEEDGSSFGQDVEELESVERKLKEDKVSGDTSAALEDETLEAAAKEKVGHDESALAKKAQNPIANLISFPIQNNTNFGIGPDDKTQNITNIQPVIPFSLSDDWNLITRTILPVVYQPELVPGEGSEFGLGDLNTTFFIAPKQDSGLTFGLGPIVHMPTNTDDRLGPNVWGLGPSAIVVNTSAPWVYGFLVNNFWKVGGDGDDISRGIFQYFVNYNLNAGWYLTSAPIISFDWKKEQSERWIVPFGGGVGKVFRIGKLPVNTSVQAYYNARTPTYGPDWTLRLQIQAMFPK